MTSFLFHYPSKPNTQVAPSSSRPWKFTVQVFKQSSPQTLGGSGDLYLFNYEDAPSKAYLCITPSGSGVTQVLEADKEIQLILEKTKSHARSQTYTIEGTESKWGDFKLAYGDIITGNQVNKGTFVEAIHPFAVANATEFSELHPTLGKFLTRVGAGTRSEPQTFRTADNVERTKKFVLLFKNKVALDR